MRRHAREEEKNFLNRFFLVLFVLLSQTNRYCKMGDPSTGALKERGWCVKGLRCKKGVVRVRYGPAEDKKK